MRHLTRSGVTLEDLPDAEPVAVREVRLEGPDGPVAVPYLLFRTRYGYHAAAGDWRKMTAGERVWLLAHEDLLNRALARDVEAVDVEARGAAARGWIGPGGHLPGNGHVPEGVVGVSTTDPVGGSGGREAGAVEPAAGDGRELPAAPGDMPEGAPVPGALTPAPLYEEVIPGIPCDLTMTTLSAALDKVGFMRPVLHVYLEGVNTAIEVVMALRAPVLIEVDPRIRHWDEWFVEWQGRRVGSEGA